ncbi:HWE histidine kinase domain-containing protein [Oleisolibacter albus]|uniref:HWE histidine kinase domain-containing protein n=1 Tax=Oleisolibacter albus TaxID=2171757 RepID=UPI00138FF651|nr:HWE histidine kinase domain-containing protein [Oleisolibacter albus]
MLLYTSRMFHRVRIASLAAAVALPILTFAGVLVIQLDASRQETVEDSLRQTARVAMDAIDGELGWHLATLETLASSPGLRSQRIEIMLVPGRRVLQTRPDWCGLALMAADGSRLMELRRRRSEPGQPTAPPAGTDPVIPLLVQQRPMILGVHTPSRCEGMSAIVLAAPVPDASASEEEGPAPDGGGPQVPGRRIILASVDPVVFTTALHRLRLPEGWTVAVLDRSALIAGRLPAPGRFIGRPAPQALAEILSRVPDDSLSLALDQDGARVYTAIHRSSRTGWAVAVGAPADLVETPIWRQRWLLIGGGGMALATAILLAFSIGRLLVEQRDSERRLAELDMERVQERRLTEVAGNLPGVIFRRILHPDGRITYPYISPSIETALGIGFGEVAAPGDQAALIRVLVPEDRPYWEAAIADSARGLTPYDVEGRIQCSDGSVRWVRSRANARRTPEDCIVWDGVAVDITDLKQAEQALRDSEQKLRLALNAGQLVLWEVDLASDRVLCDPALPLLFGLALDTDWPASAYVEAIHPEDRPAVVAELEASIAGKSVFHAEFRVGQPGEPVRWISSYSAIRRNAAGAAELVIGVNRDITAAKEAEARQRLLMREVDHRAKNALTVVQALVRVTRADSPAAFAEAVEGRVAALARTHILLARNRWEGVALHDLVRDEIAPYADTDRVHLSGPELEVEPDSTQAIGMIMHELATNAAKYGALSCVDGRVSVSWHLDRTAGLLRLEWLESGGPPVHPPTHLGFGSLLIETNAQTQLSGRARMDWRLTGLVCILDLPADRVSGRRTSAAEA